MPRISFPASVLTVLLLAGPAAAASDPAAVNRLLQEKCAASSAELRAASGPQVQCAVGRAHDLVDGKRADTEIASLALKACAAGALEERKRPRWMGPRLRGGWSGSWVGRESDFYSSQLRRPGLLSQGSAPRSPGRAP